MSQEGLFRFDVPEFENYNLEVVHFEGSEELGGLYSYEIDLVSMDDKISVDDMLGTEVCLVIYDKEQTDETGKIETEYLDLTTALHIID